MPEKVKSEGRRAGSISWEIDARTSKSMPLVALRSAWESPPFNLSNLPPPCDILSHRQMKPDALFSMGDLTKGVHNDAINIPELDSCAKSLLQNAQVVRAKCFLSAIPVFCDHDSQLREINSPIMWETIGGLSQPMLGVMSSVLGPIKPSPTPIVYPSGRSVVT